MDSSYIEMFDDDDLKKLQNALGAPPKTFFEVNRTKADDPNELYLAVAKKMAKMWPVAVRDTHEKMVPYSELMS
ncbi:hypothetical protein [Spartinivicinus ruber]|uniref:hypothetical protein n=1 Tax=Spartinivicinus ruber TaxID=2683272 RepID=UPI0013D19531|nr:hypothetical protein [Spartinivicinus ruber]